MDDQSSGMEEKALEMGCPLKIKIFTWLVAENKILIWENLQKRGWEGPSICILCKNSSETGLHLFVNCPFTSVVWNKVIYTLKLSRGWNGSSVSDCYDNWIKANPSYPSLPALLSWYIWIERNLTIFDAGSPSIQKVVFQNYRSC
jgi:hypothetical protein